MLADECPPNGHFELERKTGPFSEACQEVACRRTTPGNDDGVRHADSAPGGATVRKRESGTAGRA